MPKKYHITAKTAPPRFPAVGKYTTVEFREDCAGSCRECVKKKCVYGVFKETHEHALKMIEPEYLYVCQSCFRCVQECTKGIFSRGINPAYRNLGNNYWRRDILHRLWYQAHFGKIPVSGAGYRGPFTGKGFDAMWTDMSEIVRPTRDGIHGREYINTSIELTRRPRFLTFTPEGGLEGAFPSILEIPIPILFQWPKDLVKNTSLIASAVRAAAELETFLLLDPDDFTRALSPFIENIAFRIRPEDFPGILPLVQKCAMVEVSYGPDAVRLAAHIRKLNPGLAVAVGLPLTPDAPDTAVRLAGANVDALHFYATENGEETQTASPRFLKDCIQSVHLALVDRSLRQNVNLLFSGGIAMAEHMAKAVICGADGVVADTALAVALECRLCFRCREGRACPMKLDEDVPLEWGKQRMVNLMGAWHGQLLEVMGAMGIRETRRLRGEMGRSMQFNELEEEIFAPIFGKRRVTEYA
ncbi:MAG: hypothetical protein JRJ54_11790 [Deltaproteobacteria bacterium]|nr:hypothetical protein [Deltaproteobacteria bacterium]